MGSPRASADTHTVIFDDSRSAVVASSVPIPPSLPRIHRIDTIERIGDLLDKLKCLAIHIDSRQRRSKAFTKLTMSSALPTRYKIETELNACPPGLVDFEAQFGDLLYVFLEAGSLDPE